MEPSDQQVIQNMTHFVVSHMLFRYLGIPLTSSRKKNYNVYTKKIKYIYSQHHNLLNKQNLEEKTENQMIKHPQNKHPTSQILR